jgi:hypothetical protein
MDNPFFVSVEQKLIDHEGTRTRTGKRPFVISIWIFRSSCLRGSPSGGQPVGFGRVAEAMTPDGHGNNGQGN